MEGVGGSCSPHWGQEAEQPPGRRGLKMRDTPRVHLHCLAESHPWSFRNFPITPSITTLLMDSIIDEVRTRIILSPTAVPHLNSAVWWTNLQPRRLWGHFISKPRSLLSSNHCYVKLSGEAKLRQSYSKTVAIPEPVSGDAEGFLVPEVSPVLLSHQPRPNE